MKKTLNRNLRGFTLLELLVVLAIIGLLATIILASVGAGRSKARDAKRLVETRHLATTLQMYLIDHGNFHSILALDGVNATLPPNGSIVQALYFSTPIFPSGPGNNSWDTLKTRLADYAKSLAVDSNNSFSDWNNFLTSDSYTDGFYILAIADRDIIINRYIDGTPLCDGNSFTASWYISTVLENENSALTDVNRYPDLFGCYAGTGMKSHLMTIWGE